MDFGEVLSRAWQIIWKHKVLWIFGILAGCASGGGGSNPTSTISWQTDKLPYQVEQTVSQVQDWQWALIAGGIFLVILLIIIVAVFIGTIGKIGLVRGTIQADQEQEKLSFGELFSGSMPYFWRVFLLNLLVGLGIGLVFTALIFFGIFGTILTFGLGLFCLVPLICLLVPIGFAIGVILEQSSIAIIVENLGIMAGLKRGWEVVKGNAGTMILMWLILVLGITIIGGLIIGLPMMFTVGPIIIGAITGEEAALFGGLAVSAVCCAAYLPFLIVLSGILRSYVASAWTLTFLRLTAPAAPLEQEALQP